MKLQPHRELILFATATSRELIVLSASTLALLAGVFYGEIRGGDHVLFGHWLGNGVSFTILIVGAIAGVVIRRRALAESEGPTTKTDRTTPRRIITALLALTLYLSCGLGLKLWLDGVLPEREGGVQGLLNGLESIGHIIGRVPTLAWGPILAACWSWPVGRLIVGSRRSEGASLSPR